jgi:hypothetical protein
VAIRRTIGAVGAVGVVLVAAACGHGEAEPAAGESPEAPVVYLQEETPMRSTFEQAARRRWLVPSYVIVGEVVAPGRRHLEGPPSPAGHSS